MLRNTSDERLARILNSKEQKLKFLLVLNRFLLSTTLLLRLDKYGRQNLPTVAHSILAVLTDKNHPLYNNCNRKKHMFLKSKNDARAPYKEKRKPFIFIFEKRTEMIFQPYQPNCSHGEKISSHWLLDANICSGDQTAQKSRSE